MIFKLQLVFLKMIRVFPNVDTSEMLSFCQAGRQDWKNIFSKRQVYKAGLLFLPQPNLVHSLNREVIVGGFLSLTRVDAARHQSEWQKRPALRSVAITCQIWPIRGYTRRWYHGTSCLKERITGSAALPRLHFLPVLFSCSRFLNHRGPDYLGARNRLANYWHNFPPNYKLAQSNGQKPRVCTSRSCNANFPPNISPSKRTCEKYKRQGSFSEF